MAKTVEDIQRTWEEKISKAKKKKKEWSDLMRVDLAMDFFDGKQNPGYPQAEWITINKIYSHLMTQLPSLYSVDPYFYVKLKKSYNADPNQIAQYDKKAELRQAYLNYLKVELDLKTKARLCIQDAHFAFGCAKTHYSADEADNPDYGSPIQGSNGEPLTDSSGTPLENPKTIPINEKYCITRVDFDDLLWDEDAGPLEDKWGWIGEKIKLTKDEAENKFSKKQQKKLKASDKEKKTVSSLDSANTEPKNREVYVLWEIYDLKNEQWLTICEGASEVFQEPESLPPGVEEHPYSFLRFTLRSKSPYPIPPVSQAIDPQKELCLSRSQILTHRKRFNRKYEVVESKLVDPDSEISKLENGDDGTCIRVMANGAVTPISDAPLDQMRILELQALDRDITEIFGDAGEARGIANADSATQADIMDRRLEVREGDKLSMVTDFLADIARKLDKLVQVNISKDEAVKVAGPDGEYWSLVKQDAYDEIEGEYEYSVNVGSTAPRLPQLERAQWTAFMSQVVIPMPQVLTAPHFMGKMAEMFGIEDKAMLEELRQIGLKMMSGQMPMPGGQTQMQPGQGNPVAAILGAATGSLGGNANGGGASGGMQ